MAGAFTSGDSEIGRFSSFIPAYEKVTYFVGDDLAGLLVRNDMPSFLLSDTYL